jgi:transposase
MYQERIRDTGESKLTARRAVGAVLDINPATLRNWVEREEIDSGARPGVTTEASDELKALRREVAELRRANEILKTAAVDSTCQCNTSRSSRRWGNGQAGAAGDVGSAAGAAVGDVGVGQVLQ